MRWNRNFRGLLVKTVSLLFTVLFVYTAVSKLMHLDIFEMRLERMPYISPYASLISWVVPFLELVIAGLLWFRRYQIIAFYASFILLGVFTIYIIIVLRYSESIPCSCGGVISALGWKDHILLNISFMFLALLGILWSKKQYNMQTHQNTVQ
ncbi:MauE/DoxX family redox-associated membrane protein [Flagellimonas oceanensis]|uniref:MauE/DoxX family redox-associated membrane protein n=2 Tax=Flagellimonas oceanensis TaxID=2499163 RepID=UPI000F8E312D|nr:MauE/DoxX family redox-associated membrane protein [Allomuricauda oceanensis]